MAMCRIFGFYFCKIVIIAFPWVLPALANNQETPGVEIISLSIKILLPLLVSTT